MVWTQEKINETFMAVQKKAVVDGEFRAALLDNPGAALAAFTGEAMPEGFKIKVIENDPAYAATFVLPPMASGELGDSDLEGVAGGACFFDTCGAKGCAAAAGIK